MLKTRLLALVAAFAVGFSPMAAVAQLQRAPAYTSGGAPTAATGVFCLNLDGTSCTFGGGTGAVTGAVGSFLDGWNLTEGAKADGAATDSVSAWSMVSLLKALVAAAQSTAASPVSQNGTWAAQILDTLGTNKASVKASSTASGTGDTSLVTAQSPTPSLACNAKVTVNLTASTDLVTFTNTGYICSVVLVGAAAESWGLVDGTGTVCATGIAGVLGGTTGTMAFAANGGFVAVNDRPWLFTSGAAKHLCLLKSAAGNISGVITYRDF